jgi:hypothetical protein
MSFDIEESDFRHQYELILRTLLALKSFFFSSTWYKNKKVRIILALTVAIIFIAVILGVVLGIVLQKKSLTNSKLNDLLFFDNRVSYSELIRQCFVFPEIDSIKLIIYFLY